MKVLQTDVSSKKLKNYIHNITGAPEKVLVIPTESTAQMLYD